MLGIKWKGLALISPNQNMPLRQNQVHYGSAITRSKTLREISQNMFQNIMEHNGTRKAYSGMPPES